MNQSDRLDYLIDYLLTESQETGKRQQIDVSDNKWELFRGLCNVRKPVPVTDTFLQVQDAFLTAWNRKKPVTTLQNISMIQPQIGLWQGDITRLELDIIVNAANSKMLGCMQANHDCIDNVVHTHAGVQMRLDCHQLMTEQGHKEPCGKAKITDAYNLPAKYVIHTVGPFIDERGVSPIKEQLLASCYRKSLELADTYQVDSIAFCCIATGVFHFPAKHAAEIAIHTVKTYLKERDSQLKVIFNVYTDTDLQIYQRLLNHEN